MKHKLQIIIDRVSAAVASLLFLLGIRRKVDQAQSQLSADIVDDNSDGQSLVTASPPDYIEPSAEEVLAEPIVPDPVSEEVTAVPRHHQLRERSAKPVRKEINEHGETAWHFKSAILDRLDEYFVCFRRLKRHDRDAYDLFARMGLAIPADAVRQSRQ